MALEQKNKVQSELLNLWNATMTLAYQIHLVEGSLQTDLPTSSGERAATQTLNRLDALDQLWENQTEIHRVVASAVAAATDGDHEILAELKAYCVVGFDYCLPPTTESCVRHHEALTQQLEAELSSIG